MSKAFDTVFAAIDSGDVDLIDILLEQWACMTEDEKRLVKVLRAGTSDEQSGMVDLQFDSTTNDLADIPGLTANVAAGRSYHFEASIFTNTDAIGGQKFAIGGTATATDIIYQAVLHDTNEAGIVSSSRGLIMGAIVGGAAGASGYFVTIEGAITVATSGTLTVQFAQVNANGTSNILPHSHFIVSPM